MSKASRLIKILSLSKASSNELKEFYSFVNETNFDEFMSLVKTSANIKNHYSNEVLIKEKTNRKRLTISDDINLIRLDKLQVSTNTFAKMLTKKLNQRNPNILIPEFNSKKGLKSWIKLLSEQMSEREVYSAALSLATSDEKTDWMLQ